MASDGQRFGDWRFRADTRELIHRTGRKDDYWIEVSRITTPQRFLDELFLFHERYEGKTPCVPESMLWQALVATVGRLSEIRTSAHCSQRGRP